MPLFVVNVKLFDTVYVRSSISILLDLSFLYVTVPVIVPDSITGVEPLCALSYIAPDNVIVGLLNTVPIIAEVSIVLIVTGLSYNIAAALPFVI
jgi:hypothetical protein